MLYTDHCYHGHLQFDTRGKGNNRTWTESSFDVEWGKDLGFCCSEGSKQKSVFLRKYYGIVCTKLMISVKIDQGSSVAKKKHCLLENGVQIEL